MNQQRAQTDVGGFVCKIISNFEEICATSESEKYLVVQWEVTKWNICAK